MFLLPALLLLDELEFVVNWLQELLRLIRLFDGRSLGGGFSPRGTCDSSVLMKSQHLGYRSKSPRQKDIPCDLKYHATIPLPPQCIGFCQM